MFPSIHKIIHSQKYSDGFPIAFIRDTIRKENVDDKIQSNCF